MAETAECPECEAEEGVCVVCCPHYNAEKKTIKEGIKGRYLREVVMCKDCGYYEVVQEMDYYAEFPCL